MLLCVMKCLAQADHFGTRFVHMLGPGYESSRYRVRLQQVHNDILYMKPDKALELFRWGSSNCSICFCVLVSERLCTATRVQGTHEPYLCLTARTDSYYHLPMHRAKISSCTGPVLTGSVVNVVPAEAYTSVSTLPCFVQRSQIPATYSTSRATSPCRQTTQRHIRVNIVSLCTSTEHTYREAPPLASWHVECLSPCSDRDIKV